MLLIYFDLFIQRVWWVKQLILFSVVSLLVLVGYFAMIAPIEQQLANEKINYKLVNDEIELITQKIKEHNQKLKKSTQTHSEVLAEASSKIVLKPLKSSNCLNVISKLLINNHLKIASLRTHKLPISTEWQFSLQGDYQQLVDFFYQLKQAHYRIELCGISINQQEDNLLFSVCLLTLD